MQTGQKPNDEDSIRPVSQSAKLGTVVYAAVHGHAQALITYPPAAPKPKR